MRWITSAGGPLVLVPAMLAVRWRGAGSGASDYSAACTIDDYVGVIRWNDVDILVLNDEPLATACLVGGLTMFLRWVYAPNEDAILSAAQDVERHCPKQQRGVAFDCCSASYVLFDAGASGENIVDMIEVNIAAGPYIIETHICKPNEDVEFLSHVLRPTTGA